MLNFLTHSHSIVWNTTPNTLPPTPCPDDVSPFLSAIRHRAGGILNFGTLTVSNSTIRSNSVFAGGGIYNNAYYGGSILNNGTLTVNNSTISGNQGTFEGETVISNIVNNGTLVVNNSTT
ncbi:hypothetical protein WKK05_08155 [Nostoc sp. UHCC 0302]|uniref:hypothetical protein n=1 Tax=Nostoc sp. UHCC 0302 TaxID=3134896 RepID=UPI00311CBF93